MKKPKFAEGTEGHPSQGLHIQYISVLRIGLSVGILVLTQASIFMAIIYLRENAVFLFFCGQSGSILIRW